MGNVHLNMTLGRILMSTVAVEMQYVLHMARVCFCSLNYPTRRAHAPSYVVTCGLSVSTTISHFIAQLSRFSGKGNEYITCVFIFSTNFARNISSFKNN